MVSQTITSSITESRILLTALPEKIGWSCVCKHARFAPRSFSASATQQMPRYRSYRQQYSHDPATSPMICITRETFARGRRLSMIAISVSFSSLAIARARTRTTDIPEKPQSGCPDLSAAYLPAELGCRRRYQQDIRRSLNLLSVKIHCQHGQHPRLRGSQRPLSR